MASLIPSFVDDRTPPGERDVFNMLAAGPSEWTVLHSLDLAPWNRGLRTEIDFVAIVPDMGILCIEVKSHPHIAFDGTRWLPATITRSPFKQAADARFTFARRLGELLSEFRHVPVVHCCIFPNAPFDIRPNLSVQPWELIDSRRFRGLAGGAELCALLKSGMQRSIQADNRLSIPLRAMSVREVRRIVEHCMPVQSRHPGPRDEIRHREIQMQQVLREQQRPVLRLVSLNERILVTGGAGTGKTLIAVEVARVLALGGERVGLLCFNQLVGRFIHSEVQSTPLPNLVAGTAIKTMIDMANIRVPKDADTQFWSVVLPELLQDRLTDPEFRDVAKFDALVVDEAQDLLARPELFACVGGFLEGGWQDGRFVMLGDTEHQVLADREAMRAQLDKLCHAARPVRWTLTENCRNYRVIGETATRLAGLPKTVYSGYMRVGGGSQNYDIAFYDSPEEQLATIRRLLREFAGMGYRPSEITLLSFRGDEDSAAMALSREGEKLRRASETGDRTAYSSVHAFKGMDNKVILLTDVRLDAVSPSRDLFYTGLTRATEQVRVLCQKSSRPVLEAWMSAEE